MRKAVGVPLEAWTDTQLQEHFFELKRQLSWLRHPGILKPADFWIELDVVYAQWPSLAEPLEPHLASASLPQMLGWLGQLCEMAEEFQQLPQAIFWGRLASQQLLLSEGNIVLQGLKVERSLQLAYECHDLSLPAPPESPLEARSSCWAIAQLLREWLTRSAAAQEAWQRHPRLRELIEQASHSQVQMRPWRPSVFKARLDKIGKPRPQPRLRPPSWWTRHQGRVFAGILVLGLMFVGLHWEGTAPQPTPEARPAKRLKAPRRIPQGPAQVIVSPYQSSP